VESAEVVRELWRLFDERDWERASHLLAEDVVLEWPHSRETIRGRDNVIELNRIYPDWESLRVERLVADGDRVASLVRVEAPGGPVWAASFFDVRGGLVRRSIELWVDEGMQGTPEWREHLVERWPTS
jgi:ketosteroid isomerase-like protein